MFIGIVGSRCSGKHTVAEYLVQNHGFKLLSLRNLGKAEIESNGEILEFDTQEQMQEYVTERWRENFVTCDLDSCGVYALKKRPFFLLASVEAPLSLRYQRFKARSARLGTNSLSLEEFVQQDDLEIFNVAVAQSGKPNTPLYQLVSIADINITNVYTSLSEFTSMLRSLDLTNGERLRPSWDTYFMHLSDLAARRSNCMKRRVGCILVKDSRVVATGYNGTPRGLRNCNEGGCDRCNSNARCGTGLDRCLCMHAEENALLEAGRSRVDFGSDVVLYCNTCPCLGCAIKIVQVGVKEVVYTKSYGMDEMTAKVFSAAGVRLRQHSPPSMKLEMQISDLSI